MNKTVLLLVVDVVLRSGGDGEEDTVPDCRVLLLVGTPKPGALERGATVNERASFGVFSSSISSSTRLLRRTDDGTMVVVAQSAKKN